MGFNSGFKGLTSPVIHNFQHTKPAQSKATLKMEAASCYKTMIIVTTSHSVLPQMNAPFMHKGTAYSKKKVIRLITGKKK